MNLEQLRASNRGAPRQFRVEQSERDATVYVYDVIGADSYGGVSALVFAQKIQALDVDVLHVRINSPGGDVFEARAMATALRNFKGKTIAHIDGHAASAATYVALSCNEVVMAEGGFFMIHNAWTMAFGNAAELIQTAELLTKVDASIAADYARKTGAALNTIEDWMRAETWFTADDALKHRFVDTIDTSAPAIANIWNFSAYRHAPKNSTSLDDATTRHREWLNRRLSLLETIAA